MKAWRLWLSAVWACAAIFGSAVERCAADSGRRRASAELAPGAQPGLGRCGDRSAHRRTAGAHESRRERSVRSSRPTSARSCRRILRRYPLGSILAGGGGGPNGDDRASAACVAAAVAHASAPCRSSRVPGHAAIPVMFGIDAVHGHNNIVGAVILSAQHRSRRCARS